jgi:hypothetical protein
MVGEAPDNSSMVLDWPLARLKKACSSVHVYKLALVLESRDRELERSMRAQCRSTGRILDDGGSRAKKGKAWAEAVGRMCPTPRWLSMPALQSKRQEPSVGPVRRELFRGSTSTVPEWAKDPWGCHFAADGDAKDAHHRAGIEEGQRKALPNETSGNVRQGRK